MRYSKLWMIWAAYFSRGSFKKLSKDYAQYTIGGIAMSWASIETAIDGLTLVAYLNGGNAFSPSMPRSLSRKIVFLETSFKKLAFLTEVANEGRALLARADALSNDRHWAIHGTVMEHMGNIDLEMKVEKIRREQHYFVFERKTHSVADLADIWEKSNNLAIELFQFVRPIIGQHLENEANDAAGGR